jgi:DNA-binding transcriptional LysR family regulator
VQHRSQEALDWNLVRSFIGVVDAGSLTGAARALGLAHPTVARHIQMLEATLGLALFDRCSTGLVLNRAGARLAASARGMLESARAFEQATTAVRSSGSGLVRVIAPDSLAMVLPELLAPLRDRGPDERIRFDLMVGSDDVSLLREGADLAIRHSMPEQQDLICRRLAPLAYGLFAAPAYVREQGRPSLADLAGHRFVDGVAEPWLVRWAERSGWPIAREQFVFRADAFIGRVRSATAGWGIAALPLQIGEREPGLVRVLDDAPDFAVDLWLVGRPEVRTVAYLYDAFASIADVLNGFSGGPVALQPERVRPNRAVSR